MTAAATAPSPFVPNAPSLKTVSAQELSSKITVALGRLDSLTTQGRTILKKELMPVLREIKTRFKKGETITMYSDEKKKDVTYKGIVSYLKAVGLTDSIVRGWEFRLRTGEAKSEQSRAHCADALCSVGL